VALCYQENERQNRSTRKIRLHLGSGTVSNRKKLEQIREFSFNQIQITDCSHLLVWAAWDSYSADKVEEVLLTTSRERGLPDNTATDYKKMLLDLYEPLGKEWQGNRCAKQAYISFALAIAAAAEQKVDATPMEGFDNVKMDEFLGLENQQLKSVVILPIGYRDEANDWLLNLKKWRTPKDQFVTEIA
jgi:nitroreductase / dihydropteridine reductase